MPERCMQMLKQIITEIENRQNITRDQLALLLETTDTGDIAFLHERARKTADAIYGKQVFIRGLIEFTNYCKNDCIYCGIRKSNRKAERYRLTEEEILSCCANGYELGFRTFVLQGGEDPYFTDNKICALIRQIKAQYPDCAVTLSIGEKEHDSYQAFFDAGADRYLLRHETADEAHYGKLHPAEMFWKHRMDCLWDLKEIGYQVGCGFMVGSPEQTVDTLYEDLQFIRKLQPHMVGIGPFIPQKDTPFGEKKAGTMEDTLRLLSIIRLLQPHVLLPSTTALGTIHPLGREKGIQAGANVVMPNLSPVAVREKYKLYDNKICTGDEAAECRHCMARISVYLEKQTAENLHLSMLLPGRRFPSSQMWRERQPIRYTRQWKFIRWDRARLWTRRDSMMKVRWENSAWNGRGLQPKKQIWQLLYFLHTGLRNPIERQRQRRIL